VTQSVVKRPFASAASDYLECGWHPFPAYHTRDKSKAPCVKGVIGWEAVNVTTEMVSEWKRDYPKAQLGLRLPRNVIGIDIDMYDAKTGRLRLRQLVAEYGPLPPTWISTSRQDGSGIWLYHVEDSSQFRHDLTGGIEVIRWCGRFVMAAPSTHPKTGARYGWIRPGEKELVYDEFPSALDGDLTALPEAWAVGLRAEVPHRARAIDVGANEVRSWILGRPGGQSRPCDKMRRTFDKWNAELAAAGVGSRHSAALEGVHALCGDSVKGHTGLFWSMRELSKTLVRKRGNKDVADAEFYRLAHGEVEKRMGEPVSDKDECDSELYRGLK
jgi:hypothetical protein